jgi:hypothetical protein
MKTTTLSGKKYKKVNIVQVGKIKPVKYKTTYASTEPRSIKQISLCNAVQELLKWKEEMEYVFQAEKYAIRNLDKFSIILLKDIDKINKRIESLESHHKEQDKEIQLLKDCVQELIRNEAKHLKNHTKLQED